MEFVVTDTALPESLRIVKPLAVEPVYVPPISRVPKGAVTVEEADCFTLVAAIVPADPPLVPDTSTFSPTYGGVPATTVDPDVVTVTCEPPVSCNRNAVADSNAVMVPETEMIC